MLKNKASTVTADRRRCGILSRMRSVLSFPEACPTFSYRTEVSMPGVAKISIALTPELNDVVQDALATGDYASASEVVREALRDWKAQRERRDAAVGQLRRLWEEGVASGPAAPLEMERIKREGRKRMAAGRKRAAGR
jgi:antitoxin ParD1/3/4